MWQRDKRIVNRWKVECYTAISNTNNIYAFVEKYKIRKANTKAEQSGIRFRRIHTA